RRRFAEDSKKGPAQPTAGRVRAEDCFADGGLGSVVAVPACAAHVHTDGPAVAAAAQRCALLGVVGEGLALVTAQEGPITVNYPPPGDGPSPLGHHPPDLAGAALAQVLGDVCVGHDPALRYRLDNAEHLFREVGQFGPGHHDRLTMTPESRRAARRR